MGSYPFINYPLPGIINVLYPPGDNVKIAIFSPCGDNHHFIPTRGYLPSQYTYANGHNRRTLTGTNSNVIF